MSPDDFRRTLGAIAEELVRLVPKSDRIRALRSAAGEVDALVDNERDTARPPGYAEVAIEPVLRARGDKR